MSDFRTRYPGVSSFTDRHGKTRYRLRKGGVTLATLLGEPFTPEFDAQYQDAITGVAVARPTAQIVRHPKAAAPGEGSLDWVWAKVQERPHWKKLAETTRYQYGYLLQAWLDTKNDDGRRRGTAHIATVEPHHVQDAMDKLTSTSPGILKLMIRKLIMEAALRPSLGVKSDPTSVVRTAERDPDAGLKPWPAHICAKFEAAHNLGTTPRTAYEIAKWMGLRVSDIVRLRWDMLTTDIKTGEPGFMFVPWKGRNRSKARAKFHPMTPMVERALAHLDRSTGGHVVLNRHGKPFADGKILSQRMWEDWGPWAEIPRGFGFHGLRKAYGGLLADAGATSHESRDALDHATLKEVETYSVSRDQTAAAIRAAKKLTEMVMTAKVG